MTAAGRPAPPPILRDAMPADADAVAAIWNPVIRDTNITFWPDPRPPADIAALITRRAAEGHGFFVALDPATADRRILGFAGYGQFRAGGGYVHTLEHTVYVAPEAAGRGIATALMVHLERHAASRGGRLMLGVVTADNAASIRFHRRLGYAEWGRLPAAGWKFGRFHDALILGKDLYNALPDTGAANRS